MNHLKTKNLNLATMLALLVSLLGCEQANKSTPVAQVETPTVVFHWPNRTFLEPIDATGELLYYPLDVTFECAGCTSISEVADSFTLVAKPDPGSGYSFAFNGCEDLNSGHCREVINDSGEVTGAGVIHIDVPSSYNERILDPGGHIVVIEVELPDQIPPMKFQISDVMMWKGGRSTILNRQ